MLSLMKFVIYQMLTTIILVSTLGYLFSFVPGFKAAALFMTGVFLLSAFACGIVPCILGALLNKSDLLRVSFITKSLLSWLFSFLLTLIIWISLGLGGGTAEIWGRFLLIIIPAVFSCVTWALYSKKFLKEA